MNYREEVRKIKTQMVKELRSETGRGMMECKKALKESDWDWDAAKIILKKMPICNFTMKDKFDIEARKKQIEESNKQYEEKLLNQIIQHAVFTKEYKENGCYVKENIDNNGVTVMVMDDSWIALKKEEFYSLLSCRSLNRS